MAELEQTFNFPNNQGSHQKYLDPLHLLGKILYQLCIQKRAVHPSFHQKVKDCLSPAITYIEKTNPVAMGTTEETNAVGLRATNTLLIDKKEATLADGS